MPDEPKPIEAKCCPEPLPPIFKAGNRLRRLTVSKPEPFDPSAFGFKPVSEDRTIDHFFVHGRDGEGVNGEWVFMQPIFAPGITVEDAELGSWFHIPTFGGIWTQV